MHNNPGIYSLFRLSMHKNPGICCTFRFNMNENPGLYSIYRKAHYAHKSWNLQHFWFIMHKNPGIYSVDFAALLSSICTKNPSSCILYAQHGQLRSCSFCRSDAQDLVHDSRGPLSPRLSLASFTYLGPDS